VDGQPATSCGCLSYGRSGAAKPARSAADFVFPNSSPFLSGALIKETWECFFVIMMAGYVQVLAIVGQNHRHSYLSKHATEFK
jgi:hypothetical protein